MKFNLKPEEINYATISYKDNLGSPCTIRVEIKKTDSSFILANAKLKEDLLVPTPQEVLLKFVCSDGIYHAKSNLLSIKNETPYTFFSISLPENVEHQQKREFFRVTAKYECLYRIRETEYNTQTVDISAGGVCIIVPSEEIAKNISELVLKINNTHITTSVIHIRNTSIDNGVKASYQFNKLSEKNRELITQACLQKQMEERRKSLRLK